MTGGFYLASNKTWYDYLKRERSKARYMGLQQEFISLQEVAERHPLIDPKHYLAALWDDQDGIWTSGTTYAFAKAARHHGAVLHPHAGDRHHPGADGTWSDHAQRHHQRRIHRQLRRPVGARSRAHVGSEFPCPAHGTPLPADRGHRRDRQPSDPLALRIDYEANLYFRQERDGMLLGTYEPVGVPWKVEGTPWDFGHELLNPNLEHIADRLELALSVSRRSPTPVSGRSMVPSPSGPTATYDRAGPGHAQLLCAVGVMAGFVRVGRRPDHG